MKTYNLTDSNGELIAFEVSNTLLSRRKAVKVIEKLNGVEILKRPKWFSFKNQDVFCEFVYEGTTYQIEEPWGDNSRYWIGPKSKGPNNKVGEILECFNNG